MSQPNVETVRAAFAAWNAGDMDALRELYDVNAVTRGLEDWPEPGPNIGRDAVIRQYEQMREGFETDAVEWIGDPIDAGDLVAVRCTWRASGHGPEMAMEITGVWTIREGRIHAVEFFWDHAEALEAMGLAEKPA
jgi:ketosteroid isomerase-like protein